MADRANATPTQLADEIFKVVSDTDSNTATTALDIAKLLLAHRELALIHFQNKVLTEGLNLNPEMPSPTSD